MKCWASERQHGEKTRWVNYAFVEEWEKVGTTEKVVCFKDVWDYLLNWLSINGNGVRGQAVSVLRCWWPVSLLDFWCRYLLSLRRASLWYKDNCENTFYHKRNHKITQLEHLFGNNSTATWSTKFDLCCNLSQYLQLKNKTGKNV